MTLADPGSDARAATPAALTAARPVGRPLAARQACPTLVGRTAELERLEAVLDAVADGRAQAVLIGGDAGIGKSRVVEEFGDRARLRAVTVAGGVCVPANGGLPYAPVLGILRDLGRRLDHPSLSGPFAKTIFFESVLQTVVDAAAAAPVVLVVEDLHWIDSASSQLLDFLVRNLGDARVLVVGTYRDEEIDRDHPLSSWLAEFLRQPRVGYLELGPLGRSELANLIEDHLGERPDPGYVESIWNRSQGNPFFAEELLAAGNVSPLPSALHGVITARVERLTPAAQHLLTVAATSGIAVEHRLLVTVGGSDADVLDRAIGETVDKSILTADESGSGYRFRHALLREAVYEAILPAQRRRLHRTIAEALAADPAVGPAEPGHRAAELASHWWASGDLAAALAPSLQAADAAASVLAFREALTFLERALAADAQEPAASAAAGVSRAALLERAADIAYLAGANARAVELAQAAVDSVDAQHEPLGAARRLTLLGRNLWGTGDSVAAFEAYRAAIALLPADPPSVELARVLGEEARGYLLMSRYRQGEQRAEEAIAMARAVGARDVEGHALNTLGCCRGSRGHYDDAVALVRESLAIAEEIDSPDDMNRAYGNLASVLLDSGRLDDAAAVMFDSAAVGEELWGARLNGAAGNGVEALVRLGRYAEAERVLDQLGTQALGVCAPAPWTLPSPMLIRRGRFDLAERALATAREMTDGLEDVQQAATVLGLAAELDLERGRPDAAAASLDQALALVARSDDETLLPELCARGARSVADQVDAARATGRAVDTGAAGERAAAFAARVHDMVRAREQRGVAPTPRALAADAQAAAELSRVTRSDPQLWARAAARWEVAREAYPQAYCRWREAEAVVESGGGRPRATACLDRAWQICAALDARPLAARIEGLARRARLELSPAVVDEPTPAADVAARLGLTAREVEVLGHLAAGSSDREIAETLFISKKTVSVHVSNVLRKLSVARRVEAGKIGQAHGLGLTSS